MSSVSPSRLTASPSPGSRLECPQLLHPLSDDAGNSYSDHDPASTYNDDGNDAAEQEETASNSEEEEEEDDEEEEITRGRRRRQRIHFDVTQLQAVYHLPLKTAAERLGICEAALKRICRRNRIHKWPYRQLSSVRRRIAELKENFDEMVAGAGGTDAVQSGSAGLTGTANTSVGGLQVEGSDRHEFQQYLSSVTPSQFDDRLRRLEEEQDRIIRSAHQSRRSTEIGRRPSNTAPSYHHHPPRYQQTRRQRPVPGETLTIHLHGFHSGIADLPPLDLDRIDRDFPLLFLANVCESVRAYH